MPPSPIAVLFASIYNFVAVWKNETWTQRIGSLLTVLVAVAGVWFTFVPNGAPLTAPVPVPALSPSPDVYPDVDEGAGLESPENEGEPVGLIFEVGRVAGIVVSAILPFGCTPDQRSALLNTLGRSLAQIVDCLGSCGLRGAVDSIDQSIRLGRVNGGEITGDLLSCAEGCGTSAGMHLIAEAIPGSGVTYFGTASSERTYTAKLVLAPAP